MQYEYATLLEAMCMFTRGAMLDAVVQSCRLTAAIEINGQEDRARLDREINAGSEQHRQIVLVFRLPNRISLPEEERRMDGLRDTLGDNVR